MEHRIQSLQALIKKQKLSALLVTNPYNVRYLSGFVGTNGSLLVTPKKHLLITDARYFMTAKKAGLPYHDQTKGLKSIMGRFKSIGFESSHMTVATLQHYKKALPGAKWKGAGGLVESLRLIKDKAEIKTIKKAVKIACKSLDELQKKLKPGMSEDDVEWELLQLARANGADDFSFPPIITFGKDTADIHHQKSKNKLKKNQMVLIDSGIIFEGYITDMTRVFFWEKSGKSKKSTPNFEEKIYKIVREANQKAIDSIQVGMLFSDLDKAARQVIEAAGYGDYFAHSTGHGTGLEVHEAPTVSAHSSQTVEPGMVFTIEPGIYVEGKGGVRIEDMVYVNEKGGVEVLTTCAK